MKRHDVYFLFIFIHVLLFIHKALLLTFFCQVSYSSPFTSPNAPELLYVIISLFTLW